MKAVKSRRHRGGRPRVNLVPMRRLAVDLPLDLHERLVEQANDLDTSLSEIVRDALTAHLGGRDE